MDKFFLIIWTWVCEGSRMIRGSYYNHTIEHNRKQYSRCLLLAPGPPFSLSFSSLREKKKFGPQWDVLRPVRLLWLVVINKNQTGTMWLYSGPHRVMTCCQALATPRPRRSSAWRQKFSGTRGCARGSVGTWCRRWLTGALKQKGVMSH